MIVKLSKGDIWQYCSLLLFGFSGFMVYYKILSGLSASENMILVFYSLLKAP